jgi:two-component system cell cycle sensor histidine kinase/response regulator CckA
MDESASGAQPAREPAVPGSEMLGMINKAGHLVVALLESASQAIVAVDGAGRMVLANRRAEEIFGYSRSELLGQSIEMLLPESRRGLHARERDRYFARPHIRPMGSGLDLAARHKDGREFPVEVSLSYVDAENRRYAIAFISDISQRKNLEEQLLHAQKMEAVGRLAGGVAHDFNNMLTVVTGYDRMILDELSPPDPLRGYAEEILRAAERAGALTNQLLAFSRRQIMRPRIVSVNSILSQTEKMLLRLIGEDVVLRLNLDPAAGNIQADPGHVEQAVVNLAVNARDAMPLGGRLTIETANVTLDEHYARSHMGVKPGEFVLIAVSDTGHGMDAETRRHIFEPFFTTKEKGKGTGLGLATVYGMIKQTGGDIWVYSEPGNGTTFKLYFPRVAEPATDSRQPKSGSALRASGETVLVVEDEKAVRDLTVRILQQLGYTILTAGDAAEALEIGRAHAGEIHLLLTDVVMPGMSGRQLADQLIQHRPGTRVLFLSGYTEDTVVHHGVLDAGVNFLPKPFSRENLARKLREVLEKP